MKIYSLISLLLVSVLLLGCLNAPTQSEQLNQTSEINSSVNQTMELKLQTFKAPTFTINYPIDWKEETSNYDLTDEYTFTPTADGDASGVIVSIQKYSTRAPPTLQELKAIQKTKENQYATITSSEEVKFQNKNALKTTFKINTDALNGMIQTDYHLIIGANLYKLTYLVVENDTQTVAKLEQMINSIKIN